MRPVYLDNNATTALLPEVWEEMVPYFRECYGNASSIHTPGQRARAAVDTARERAATLLNTDPKCLVFTSGGTEADNLAILGIARAAGGDKREVITTRIEHPAVLRACESLEKEGWQVTYLPVDAAGVVALDELDKALSDKTLLVSVMSANNETGTIQPLAEIVAMAQSRGALVHTDAVQAVGKIPLDIKELQVDLLSLSAHKFHGPKGIGALFIRQGTPLAPLQLGGSHEGGRRGGTENVPGIVGLGKACERAERSLSSFSSEVGALRDRLEAGFRTAFPEAVVNGEGAPRVPHVTNISFCGVQGESLLISLDFAGIAVSTGAACTAGMVAPSHVLKAMGLSRERLQGAIRFSLGRLNSIEDIDYTLEAGIRAIQRIKDAAVSSR